MKHQSVPVCCQSVPVCCQSLPVWNQQQTQSLVAGPLARNPVIIPGSFRCTVGSTIQSAKPDGFPVLDKRVTLPKPPGMYGGREDYGLVGALLGLVRHSKSLKMSTVSLRVPSGATITPDCFGATVTVWERIHQNKTFWTPSEVISAPKTTIGSQDFPLPVLPVCCQSVASLTRVISGSIFSKTGHHPRLNLVRFLGKGMYLQDQVHFVPK